LAKKCWLSHCFAFDVIDVVVIGAMDAIDAIEGH
jgi:hypothetical protein